MPTSEAIAKAPGAPAPYPEIAPADVDAARRFLLGVDAPPAAPSRLRHAAPSVPVASFGISRARRRGNRNS